MGLNALLNNALVTILDHVPDPDFSFVLCLFCVAKIQVPRRLSGGGGGASNPFTETEFDIQCESIHKNALLALQQCSAEDNNDGDDDDDDDVDMNDGETELNEYTHGVLSGTGPSFFKTSASTCAARTAVAGLLLARVVRVRFRRHLLNNVKMPKAKDVKRVFDTLCSVMRGQVVRLAGIRRIDTMDQNVYLLWRPMQQPIPRHQY